MEVLAMVWRSAKRAVPRIRVRPAYSAVEDDDDAADGVVSGVGAVFVASSGVSGSQPRSYSRAPLRCAGGTYENEKPDVPPYSVGRFSIGMKFWSSSVEMNWILLTDTGSIQRLMSCVCV